MAKQNKRHPIAEALSRMTELPVEALCTVSVVCIKGREEAEIAGCRGIFAYDDEQVVLKTSDGRLTLTGSRLILSDFRDDTITVRGVLRSVTLGEAEEKEGADV